MSVMGDAALLGVADFPAFCGAILLFLAIPGPGTFTLLTSVSKGGLRAGAAATVGLILGDQVLLWMALAGLAALLTAHPLAFRAVQWGGAAYLGWIGLRLLFARDGSSSPIRIEPRHYVRQAFLITLLNPKAIVFYMAFFPLFIDPAGHPGTATFLLMAGTIAAITAVYCLGLSAFALLLSRRLQGSRSIGRWIERLAGLLLIGFGIRLLRG